MAGFAEPSHRTFRRDLIPSEDKKTSLVYTKDALKRVSTQRPNARYRLTRTSPVEEGRSKRGVLAESTSIGPLEGIAIWGDVVGV